MLQRNNNLFSFLICFITALIAAGCGGPRARWGFTPLEKYGDPNQLGTHSYNFSGSEGYGVFYTLRGGSIDLDHVRGIADLTRWTYLCAKATIEKGKSSFAVGPGFEMTTNKVIIEYPDNWGNWAEAEKKRISHKAALIIAPVVSYNCSIWHEMITWKGTHFMLIEPEHNSAFSWDDLYSNMVGVELALRAINNGHINVSDYNRAMTALIAEEFQTLEVVSKARSVEIIESVRGTWHGNGKLMKRNMDIGYDDGIIMPIIIPGYTDQPPIPRSIPTFAGLEELGIKVQYTISSAYYENFELKKIAGAKGDVEPLSDYPKIMKNIEAEAIDKYGYQIR